MAVEYDYTASPVAVDRLTKEINNSTISTALDHINLYGTALAIFFKASLSGGDKTTLDALVAAHTGVPLPSNAIPVTTDISKNVTWSAVKAFALARGTPIQYLDFGDGNYYIYSYDGPFSVTTIITKVSPASSDQTDFESNYKSNTNKPIGNQTEKSAYARSGQMFSVTTGIVTLGSLNEAPLLLLKNPSASAKSAKLNKITLTAPTSSGTLSGGAGNDNIYNFYRNPNVANSSLALTIVGNRQLNQKGSSLFACKTPGVVNLGSLYHSSDVTGSDTTILDDFSKWIDPGSSILITVIPNIIKNKCGITVEFAEE